jgi:hypothetical protein
MYLLNNSNSEFEFNQTNGLEISIAKENPQNGNPKELTPVHKKEYGDSNSNQSLFISVREKIGFYELIIPEYNLSDQAILLILNRWQQILGEHCIQVLFTENPVNQRGRYQFLSEVFFDMLLPIHPNEMQFCFVYDRTECVGVGEGKLEIVRDIILSLLNQDYINVIEPLNKRVRLNSFENLSEPELYYVVNQYKKRCSSIINRHVSVKTNKMRGERLIYVGSHETYFCYDNHSRIAKGCWQLEMVPVQGTWLVVDIQVEGLDF